MYLKLTWSKCSGRGHAAAAPAAAAADDRADSLHAFGFHDEKTRNATTIPSHRVDEVLPAGVVVPQVEAPALSHGG